MANPYFDALKKYPRNRTDRIAVIKAPNSWNFKITPPRLIACKR